MDKVKSMLSNIIMNNSIPSTLAVTAQLMRVYVDKNQKVPVIVRGKSIYVNNDVDCTAKSKYLLQASLMVLLHHTERYEQIKHKVSLIAFNIASNAITNEWLLEILTAGISPNAKSTYNRAKMSKIKDIYTMLRCRQTDSIKIFNNDIFFNDIEEWFGISQNRAASMTVEQLAIAIQNKLIKMKSNKREDCDDSDTGSDNKQSCNTSCNTSDIDNQLNNQLDDYSSGLADKINAFILPDSTMHPKDATLILDNHEITYDKAIELLRKLKKAGDEALGVSEIIRIEEIRRDIDWRKLLTRTMLDYGIGKKVYDVKRSFSRFNKRIPHMPGYYLQFANFPNIYVVIDTSGSMEHELLSTIFARILWLDSMKKVNIYYFDVNYYGPYTIRDLKQSNSRITVKGRGGTSPAKILNHLRDIMTNKDVLIFISDFIFSKEDLTYTPDKAIYIKVMEQGKYEISSNPYKLFD